MSISVSLWYTYIMENENLNIRSVSFAAAADFIRKYDGDEFVFYLHDKNGEVQDVLITEPYIDRTLIEILGWCDIDQSELYRSYRNAMADVNVYRVGPIGSDL